MIKIVVPDGMLKAALDNGYKRFQAVEITVILEAALRWLSENPPLPTRLQCEGMWRSAENNGDRYCQEWVKQMFLAPEPEVPEEIKDLLEWDCNNGSNYLKKYIVEAFRRGKKQGLRTAYGTEDTKGYK